MSTFAPLLRVKLSDQITERLREAIGAGQYRPGEPLPSERELATAFGASRVAIREALVALQAQGLVERSHGRAARVSQRTARYRSDAGVIRLPENPTEHDVRNVKQARIVLEVEMARVAAQTCSPAAAEKLKAALEANRKAIGDPGDFLETDMALHEAICSLSGNGLFVEMGHDLLRWLACFQTEAVHVEGSVMLSHREHARIVERIVSRDPDGAAKAMLEHLARTHLAYGRLHSLQSESETPPLSSRAQV